MRMSLYYRMMLSYTPIFFVVISSVIFVFFGVLNRTSENRYIETNQTIVEQMMQGVEAHLKLIEQNAVNVLINDRLVGEYFSQKPKSMFDYYMIQKKIIDLKFTLPFASSIYLYDEASGQILSDSNRHRIDGFADHDFLTADQKYSEYAWTDPREYSLSTLDRNKQQVVSIVKRHLYPNMQEGTIVVNLYVSSLLDFLNQYRQPNDASVYLLDTKGDMFRAHNGQPSSQFSVVSAYTGWTYDVDKADTSGYTLLSLLSNVWVVLVLVIILLALVWFTIITHIHYKPIQSLVDKIGVGSYRRSGIKGVKSTLSEFKVIESAIDNLLEQANDYQMLQEAEATHRKRLLIQELLVGHLTMGDAQWKESAAPLLLPIHYDAVCAISVELDRYGSFTATYKPSDQHLLKYILEHACRETAGELAMELCSVWIRPHEVAFLLFLNQTDEPYEDRLLKMCNDYRRWIADNLDLTVSIGIGAVAQDMIHISDSYRTACSHVALKTVFGTNAVIDSIKADTKSNQDVTVLVHLIPEFVHLYRKGDENWREKLAQMIAELRKRRLGVAEIHALTVSLEQQLEKEMMSLSPVLDKLWKDTYDKRFAQMRQHVETLEDMHRELESTLEELAVQMQKIREESSSASIAQRMKMYIDAHFADPELSLAGIGGMFGMPASYASTLFKKEVGEKFIDYVMRIRLEHARGMLLESDEPIQFIAEQVGYTHVLSFHRAFKKTFGVPPGEFREIYRKAR